MTFETSVDVGAVFGSSGFLDFTIHDNNILWGIELLREGSKLEEHVSRFASGKYSTFPLSDYCLVDFRRVSSIKDVTSDERIMKDLNANARLFIVCYDSEMKKVSLLKANSVWRIFE